MTFNGNGNLTGSAQYFSDKLFYNGVATQSLRFAYTTAQTWLARTPNAGNRKTHTLSVWIKRSGLSASQNILEARGSGDTGNVDIWFDANDRLEVSGSSTYWRTTTRKFRDVSSWYHIMIVTDTTDGTAADRLKIYVNGTRETSFSDNNHYSQNTDYAIGGNVEHRIGDGYGHFDGYMARYEFVDGIALDASYFGETKNGVWIPKKYTGSYGTNGHLLEFKQTGTSANSSGLGADTSGNDNHYTPTEITAIDSNLPDSPENNFCTFNSVGRRYGQSYVATFSEGNLKATNGGNATHIWGSMAINQIASQGGVYFEIRIDSLDTARTYFGVIGDNGADNKNSGANNASYTYPIKGLVARSLYGYFGTDSTSINLITGNTVFSAGDVAGIAILSDGKFFMHRNGTYLKNASGNVGNPSTGTNEIATIDLTLGDWVPYAGYNSSFSINFGQDGSFSGNETSGGYQDGNGIGDFMFAVPTNCLAICSSNMAEPTISPNADTQADDYFNTLIYDGNDDATRTFDVGFVSDWSWFKARNADGIGHQLYDSSRGVQKFLATNTNGDESDNTEGVTDFDDSGLLKIGNSNFLNKSGRTHVLWNWKANGGTTSTNDAGSIQSTVQANTTSGFSIVTYTSNNSAGATVGHGLTVDGSAVAPQMVIIKKRSADERWFVWHGADPTRYIYLNETFAGETSNLDDRFGNNSATTLPSSTVLTLGTSNDVNGSSGSTYVAYCFAEVEGYSKFGSYTGNGSNDGTFVHLGFRPAFIMTKRAVGGTSNWIIQDSVRQTFNPSDAWLRPNESDDEGDTSPDLDLDFVSNGFKIRNNGTDNNISGSTYIYMAFAENPFKYANAR